ncbi:hypothetical protein RvY_08284 [Ramazzottius varieornatus]|uniref:Uncharacterized protein n=1 Tax=Ramazzottius varieornatus TaxID=947166 RepID=A0A1D1V814_RAMVA|nr:hypothetical protein RvY_08284 [Ramazzottius varieornatus]
MEQIHDPTAFNSDDSSGSNLSANFVGRRALVTGGARGIGRGITLKLAQLNAEVFVLDNSVPDLEQLKADAASLGYNNIHARCVDLSDWDATYEVVSSLLPTDLLVNNVGIVIQQKFLSITPEAFDRTININTRSALNVSQVVAKSMTERKCPGSIVNIASLASVAGGAGMGCYSASKAALDSLTRSMALELGPNKIRVNSVQPTFIATEMTKPMASSPAFACILNRIPLGPEMGEVEDVVNAVIYLLSDRARFVSGVHLRVDGGHYCNI